MALHVLHCIVAFIDNLYEIAGALQINPKKGGAVDKNIKNNEENHKILIRYEALAFFPSQKIEAAFEYLVENCR